jgi:hypothetical protein
MARVASIGGMRTNTTTLSAAARRAGRAAALALALGSLAACGDRRATSADSAMTQDLAAARADAGSRDLTRAEAPGAQPELRDVSLGAAPAASRTLPAGSSVDRARAPEPAPPKAPPPAAPKPAPTTRAPVAPSAGTTAPAPAPPTTPAPTPAPATPPVAAAPITKAAPGLQPGTMATGTVLRLTPHIRVCTNSSSVGDVFEATLASAVTGVDGATIPAGANVVLRVTGLTRSGDDAVLAFEITAVGVTRRSYVVTVVDAGGAVKGSARAPSEIEKGAGRASAEEVARFGTCVPRDGELTVTLTRGIRLSAAG